LIAELRAPPVTSVTRNDAPVTPLAANSGNLGLTEASTGDSQLILITSQNLRNI
jgi:hypothetical protein